MIKHAVFSADNKYRYTLSRIWDEDIPALLFIMLNPSTADSEKDDPTIRRLIHFTTSWGYGGFYVVNLYAFCSTDPNELNYAEDPVGEENLVYIQTMIERVEKVVYAWGNRRKEPKWLYDLVKTPYCIDISKKGIPKHPLYLKKELGLQPYRSYFSLCIE